MKNNNELREYVENMLQRSNYAGYPVIIKRDARRYYPTYHSITEAIPYCNREKRDNEESVISMLEAVPNGYYYGTNGGRVGAYRFWGIFNFQGLTYEIEIAKYEVRIWKIKE